MDPGEEPVLWEGPTSIAEVMKWMVSPERPTLLGVDVAIGLPRGHGAGFRAWLESSPDPIETRTSCEPDAWSMERPFFRVPAGRGALTAFRARGRLTRRLDDAVGGKSPFILSGIPGCVGSSCVQLWEYLRREGRAVRVWPFDGPLSTLLAPGEVVLGEIYPSAQLRALLPEARIRKSRWEDRAAVLGTKELPAPAGPGLERARQSEDVFDAWVGLVQLAMAASEGILESSSVDPVHEGGLLGSLL